MSNRLIKENSPYLRQHSDNPVDWFPWCEEAFQRAEAEDKPIFLSIGYSTCHWCHVMAHESFEDEDVAAILNKDYISIKVDREERPDIDSVYMKACQALTGSGGWPLTVIMTPQQQPFFAGTYIPKDSSSGRPGLKKLLRVISGKWRNSRRELVNAAEELSAWISKPPAMGHAENARELPAKAAGQFLDSLDSEYGGFGSAPKFPAAHNLIFLLRYAALSGQRKAREAVELTLRQMYRGGIFDHIGGGFCRYSTDREWLAPHFEKTLYDNALLALCYTEAWQDGRMALYRQVAESTLDYCMRELRSEEGAFYCAQDADSSGSEGLYYLFSPSEIKKILGEDEGRHFCECYDITEEGNFAGSSIPNLLLNTRWNFLPEGYEDYREKLRIYRQERYALHRDEKILTAWNGLMLMALSRAARAFGDRRYLNAARELARFMESRLFSDGRLISCYYPDSASLPAQLDDYVFYALGLLELYSADYEPGHITKAARLGDKVLEHFTAENGGFYRTADDSPALISRPLETYDGAMPSGNSAAAVLFDELSRFTAEEKWRDAHSRQLDFLSRCAGDYPAGISFGLCGFLSLLWPTKELVCVSVSDSVPELFASVTGKYAPELRALLKTEKNAELLSKVAPFTSAYSSINGRNSFYVCSGGTCSLPFTD